MKSQNLQGLWLYGSWILENSVPDNLISAQAFVTLLKGMIT